MQPVPIVPVERNLHLKYSKTIRKALITNYSSRGDKPCDLGLDIRLHIILDNDAYYAREVVPQEYRPLPETATTNSPGDSRM